MKSMMMMNLVLIVLLCCSIANAFLLVEQPISFAASKWATCHVLTKAQGNLRSRHATKLSLQSSGRETLKTTTARGRQRRRTWDESFQLLLKFKEEHGHCNVPYGYKQDPRLAGWTTTQRQAKKSAKLSEDHRKKLDAIGFSWNAQQDSWNDSYKKLMQYKENHGDCDVPYGWFNDKALSIWVAMQRGGRDLLSEERRSKLDKIGFSWNLTRPWDELYQELVAYSAEHGDCNIPCDDTSNPALADWVSRQRRRKEVLSIEQRNKLDAIKFTWENSSKEINDKRWHGMLDKLKKYRRKHGDCLVPHCWSKDPSLGNWVSLQRKNYKSGQLSEDREKQLTEIGFAWRLRSGTLSASDEVRTQKWLDKYEAVKMFQGEHGHTNVPKSYNSTLAIWIQNQRASYRTDRLQEDRRLLLEDIGFEWEIQEKRREQQWQIKYEDIRANMNGSSPVGTNHAQTAFLHRQRVAYANGRLQKDRQRLLEEIGFELERGKPFFRS